MFIRGRRSFMLALLFVVTAFAGVAFAQAAIDAKRASVEAPLWEHWYTLELAGQTAGWMRETVYLDGSVYRSETESKFKVSRGPIELEIKMSGEFVETKAGKPLRLHFVQDLSLQKIETFWEFTDDVVKSTTKQGGRELKKDLPLPDGTWLTPMGVHRYLAERREAGAKEITYRTVLGESGLAPITIKHEFIGDEEIEIQGRMLAVTVWRTTNSATPGMASTSRISRDGHLVQDEVSLPFGKVMTRLSTKLEALALGLAPAPEMMVSTFVKADKPIERVRQTTTSTLRLRIREGEMPEIPSAGAQRVKPGNDAKSVLLKVDINDNLEASAEDVENAEYLMPSVMADSTDPQILALTKSALRRVSDDPYDRAEALRRFVHKHISAKSLDTAFATASETARMRTGDCSEHGVLLCALMRAADIPSRVATGLIYADAFAGETDIFGWHMWTQALIDGKWVDYDATLRTRYDAAHVLTGTSPLADGAGTADLASLMMLMGNLEIDVVAIAHD